MLFGGISHAITEEFGEAYWDAHLGTDYLTRTNLLEIPEVWPPEYHWKRVGIDYFAFGIRHEAKHVELNERWGATLSAGMDIEMPQGTDTDDDELKDGDEDGSTYVVGERDTDDDGMDDGHQYVFFTQQKPTRHAYDGEDWSDMGCTYTGVHYE